MKWMEITSEGYVDIYIKGRRKKKAMIKGEEET